MAGSSIFRIPAPKSFFYLMSLRTGTELIVLTLLINKISGLYGILALLTGFHLSSPQLSMYIYSILALFLASYLAPSIRTSNRPVHVLALAWFYFVDTLINACYTAAFGVSWFLVLARHTNPLLGEGHGNTSTPGADTMGDIAGFTSPEKNVSSVDVHVSPSEGILTGEAAALAGKTGTLPGNGAFNDAIFQSGSIASITIISFLWLIRFYFVFILFAFSRGVLRQYIVNLSHSSDVASRDGMTENPFASHMPDGKGWKGKLGRSMIAVPKRFWLGVDEDGEWLRSVSGRFGKGRQMEEARPFERERRRRKGTGPPVPSADFRASVELQNVGK